MPANTTDAARPVRSHRWLASAIKTASEPLPALPFDRANRSRPASLVPASLVPAYLAPVYLAPVYLAPTPATRPASIAAH